MRGRGELFLRYVVQDEKGGVFLHCSPHLLMKQIQINIMWNIDFKIYHDYTVYRCIVYIYYRKGYVCVNAYMPNGANYIMLGLQNFINI